MVLEAKIADVSILVAGGDGNMAAWPAVFHLFCRLAGDMLSVPSSW
jgi:hypothetical protein